MIPDLGNIIGTMPNPTAGAGAPDTVVTDDDIGVYFQKCLRCRKIWELAPPSTCVNN